MDERCNGSRHQQDLLQLSTCLAVKLWNDELNPVSHGSECMAGTISAAVGSLELGHTAERGR